MLFNSLAFLAFFPVVCLVYFLLPTVRTRNIWLLAASYYFYMSWQPLYALLLLTSTLITYLAAIGISRSPKHKKIWLVASVTGNLAILFFFKYFNWAADNVETVMNATGIAMSVPHLDVLLPVGISFYTFQALGYSIDVYWGDVKPERDFLTYALFVSFFPQLVAGPIERSTGLLPQFRKKHPFDGDKAITGTQLMLWGFFLKLVVANNIAHYVDGVYNQLDGQTGGDIFMASVLFCIQLYGDFAGYSYIAIGASRIMGFKLMDNFLRPYFFSASIQEYWKRNHISLTTWFMDYIYYPMVGSSINKYWWCFCIFITFFISGFWHGANWTYVVCFSIFGLYLVVCMLKEKWQRKWEKRHGLRKAPWWIWCNRAVTFLLVAFALIFFRANTIQDGWYAVRHIFSSSFFHVADMPFMGLSLIFFLFITEYVIEYKKADRYMERHFLRAHVMMSLVLAALTLWLGEFTGGQFIYFQF